MPNWTYNILHIDAEPDVKAKIKEAIASDESILDFNKIIPMPESLNVTSGSSNDPDIYYYLSERLRIPLEQVSKMSEAKLINNMFNDDWLKEICRRLESGEVEGHYDIGQLLVSNYRKYGATTWYDWCRENWGTKWNASDVRLEEGPMTLHYYFDTAWSSPRPVIQKLSEMFPDAYVEHFYSYEDEDDCYHVIEYRAGVVMEEYDEDPDYYAP